MNGLNYRRARTVQIAVANGQTSGTTTIAVPEYGRVWLDSICPVWDVYQAATPASGEYKFEQAAAVKARIHERTAVGVPRTVIGQTLDCADGTITVTVTVAAVSAATRYFLTYFLID